MERAEESAVIHQQTQQQSRALTTGSIATNRPPDLSSLVQPKSERMQLAANGQQMTVPVYSTARENAIAKKKKVTF